MAAGTLYTYPQSFRANKILIAAEYSGSDVKVDNSFKFGETNTSANFLKKFPIGKVPAFEAKDGFYLSESNAIAYYVSNSKLHGTDAKQAALVQQWISFSDNEILPAACTWTFPCLGITQFNKNETTRAQEQVRKVLGVLNAHLLTRTFVVGERVTLADISLMCNMQSLYELVLDPAFRKPYVNVNRWFTTLINQPQFKKVLGSVTLATSMATFDAKKYQALHGGSGDNKKGQEAKKEKAAPKPKEEKSKPAVKAPEEPKEAPKAKDPLADLPGKMDLDEFKRTYSNAKGDQIEKVAVPYFWKNFDKDNYSIWKCTYNEDYDKQRGFQLSNLVGGFLQRLDKLRKHAFGTMVVAGDDNTRDFLISGVWFWKGPKLCFDLCEDWNVDAPSYKWTKLNPDEKSTKDMVMQYFTMEGKFEGKEYYDGKVFK